MNKAGLLREIGKLAAVAYVSLFLARVTLSQAGIVSDLLRPAAEK